LFSPRIISHWIKQDGKHVTNEKQVALLDKPYSKESSHLYQDRNIRPEMWAALEDEYPEEHWPELVDKIVESSRAILTQDYGDISCDDSGLCCYMLASSVLFLVSTVSICAA